jgi:hypothetical protein
MQRVVAAARAAEKVLDALRDLEMDGVLRRKRSRQHPGVMQYYGEILRDLSRVQEPLLEKSEPPRPSAELPKELTDLLQTQP